MGRPCISGEIGSRKSPMRYRTWMYIERGTKASTRPIHDATRNSPFCHREPGFSGAAGGHGLKFHWRVLIMGHDGTDMYPCTA